MDGRLGNPKRRLVRYLVPVGVGMLVVALASGYWALRRAGPVLIALRESGDVRGEPVWSLFNPLRDRSPEVAAEQALDRVRRGEIAAVLETASSSGATRGETARREATYRLQHWRLVHRDVVRGDVRLYYSCRRMGDDGVEAPLWLRLRPVGGEWQVTGFEAWY